MVTDAEAGLFEFASPAAPAIDGALKTRPEDFVVNELHSRLSGQSTAAAASGVAARAPPVCDDAAELLAGDGGDGPAGPGARPAAEPGQMCVLEFVLHKAGLGTVDALRELAELVWQPAAADTCHSCSRGVDANTRTRVE